MEVKLTIDHVPKTFVSKLLVVTKGITVIEIPS